MRRNQLLVCLSASAIVLGLLPQPSQATTRLGTPDFDKDQRPELVIGGQEYEFGCDHWDCYPGFLSIYEGGTGGTLTHPGTVQGSESSFGEAAAFGDFNGDGFDDLAVGAPWFDLDADLEEFDDAVLPAGAVLIWYGDTDGLGTGTDLRFFDQQIDQRRRFRSG